MPKKKPHPKQIRFHGAVPAQRAACPVYLATDAAADPKIVGGGYLATTGHYGGRAHPYPADISGDARVAVAELRAVLWGLEAVTADVAATREIVVETDSLEALSYLRAWRKGEMRMPEGYRVTWRATGDKPALHKLQEIVEYTPKLTFRHVKGHACHPLNECADSLAKLAYRTSKGVVSRERAAEIAPDWARRNLADFTSR